MVCAYIYIFKTHNFINIHVYIYTISLYERFVLSYGLRAEKNKMSPCHECWAHLQFQRTRYEAVIGGESKTEFDMNLYQCMPS